MVRSPPTSTSSSATIARTAPLTGDPLEPTEEGSMVTVACPRGVAFMHWVTPEHAEAALPGEELREEWS